MNYEPETPFDSIESAHKYLTLLLEAAQETRDAVGTEIGDSRHERRTAVMQLVAYNLAKLEAHVKISRRILNDLRTLRRLLLEERSTPSHPRTTRDKTSRVIDSPTASNIVRSL